MGGPLRDEESSCSENWELPPTDATEAHPATTTTVTNLGLACEKLGCWQKALELHDRALAAQRQVFGASHPDVARTLSHLGQARTAEGSGALGWVEASRVHFSREGMPV